MSIPTYLPTPIAARLLGAGTLAELVSSGRLRRFGGKHGHYLAEDIAWFRGRPIDPDELAFAEHQHRRRLASYARQNSRRKERRMPPLPETEKPDGDKENSAQAAKTAIKTAASIAADIAALETRLATLHDDVARTGLAAYRKPGAEAARKAAEALEALRAATDRLDSFARRDPPRGEEAAAERAAADAELLAAYDKIAAERDAAVEKAEAASSKYEHQAAILRAEQGCLDWFSDRWAEQEPVVEKAAKLADDFEWAADERWARAQTLEEALAGMPRSVAEQEALAAEDARQEAQEIENARREYERDTERQLAEIHDAELVDAPEPFTVHGLSQPRRMDQNISRRRHGTGCETRLGRP